MLLQRAPSIYAIAGGTQSATANTASATDFEVEVTNGTASESSSVAFTALETGSKGSFERGGSTATATARADTAGVAVLAVPSFVANTTSGTYIVSASTMEAVTPATFSLVNFGASVLKAVAGTSGTTLVGATFPTEPEAEVTAASGSLYQVSPSPSRHPRVGQVGALPVSAVRRRRFPTPLGQRLPRHLSQTSGRGATVPMQEPPGWRRQRSSSPPLQPRTQPPSLRLPAPLTSQQVPARPLRRHSAWWWLRPMVTTFQTRRSPLPPRARGRAGSSTPGSSRDGADQRLRSRDRSGICCQPCNRRSLHLQRIGGESPDDDPIQPHPHHCSKLLARERGRCRLHFGTVSSYGLLVQGPRAHAVTVAAIPNGEGYWLLGANGSAYSFGVASGTGEESGFASSDGAVGSAITAEGHIIHSDGSGSSQHRHRSVGHTIYGPMLGPGSHRWSESLVFQSPGLMVTKSTEPQQKQANHEEDTVPYEAPPLKS